MNLDTLVAVGIEEIIGTTNAQSTLTGDDIPNSWEITNLNEGILNGTLNFADFNNLIGGNLEDTFILNGGTVSSINGGGSPNTLIGDNSLNIWNLTDVNTGNLNGTNFTGIQNLTGGSLDDSFVFDDGVSFNGSISDNGGTDNFDFSAYTTLLEVNLSTLGAIGIEEVIGTNLADSTLIGANTPNNWEITNPNAGILNGTFNFADFNNLIGGNLEDTFILNGGTVSSINGGGGTNTLIGDDTLNTWSFRGFNTGNLNGANNFTRIQNLTGGSLDDSFVFDDGVSFNGSISDNGGTDNFDFSAYTSDPNVNLNTLGAVGIEQIIGTTAAESTLIGANSANTWEITDINTGILNGTLNFTDFCQSHRPANLEDTFIINGGNITNINGGAGSNSLVAEDTVNIWNLTGSDTGNLNGTNNFTQIQNFTSGSLDDTFLFSDRASISGNLEGGLGNLTLIGAGSIDTRGFTLTGADNAIITLLANQDIFTGDIINPGGEITLISNTGTIKTGNLNSSAATGGEIFIDAQVSITTGEINSSGSIGNGGNLTLDPIGDIQVSFINTQGGSDGIGGNVEITTSQFFSSHRQFH